MTQKLSSVWIHRGPADCGFAARLQHVMRLRGVGGAEVSRMIDVDCGRMRRWSLGEMKPRVDTLIRLCVALDVSADWLLGLGGPAPVEKRSAEDGWLP